MRIFGLLLIQVLVFCLHGSAQNLIPNAGFEEIFTRAEHQWVQPQGPFYHYEETTVSTAHKALKGRYVNGICMYNNEPNEYLHVKLLEPLFAGQTYYLEVSAILMLAKCFKAEEQWLIGVHFGNKRLNTHLPGDLGLKPQVNLELPQGNRFQWFQMADTFTAAGGEQYMTVGYFPGTQLIESMVKAQDAFFEELDRNAQAKEKANERTDLAYLYMPPDEQKKYLKEQKKKEKKRSESNASEYKKLEDRKSDLDPVRSGLQAFFSVRYYFDEFCLTPYREGEEPECHSTANTEEIATGRTINLRNVFFGVDKATLLEESIIQLKALQKLLNDYPEMRIEIRGYTDSQGEDVYNLNLSKQRASAVVDWLVGQGISAERLQSAGFGEADPVETNETEAGRALNRRVTFFILSM